MVSKALWDTTSPLRRFHGDPYIFTIIPSNTMPEYFGPGFHVLTTSKSKIPMRQGTQVQNLQMGVRGQICVSLGVLDVKKFEPLV